jgi:hypothetical protein
MVKPRIFTLRSQSVAMLGILLFAVPCLAAEWVEVAKTASDDVFLLDVTSIKKGKGSVKGWVYAKYGSEKKASTYKEFKLFHQVLNTYQSSKLLFIWDCARNTSATTQYVRYENRSGSGEVVETGSYSFMPEDVVPDSVEEAILMAACSYAFKKKK